MQHVYLEEMRKRWGGFKDGETDQDGLFTDEDSGDQVWYTGIYFTEVTRLDNKRQQADE